MKDIIIYGAGSVGKLTEQIISDINKDKKQFNILGFLDDDKSKHNASVFDYKIFGDIEWLKTNNKVNVVFGFSSPSQKLNLIERLKEINHTKFVQLIHPKAWVSKRVEIGKGSIIYPGTHIDVDVKIGDFVLLNKLCSIGHDSILKNYSTISPGVNIGGFNYIEEGVDFGINACSIQNIKIGKWSTIGAGSVIIKNVEDRAVIVGNPGKVIKYN